MCVHVCVSMPCESSMVRVRGEEEGEERGM